MTEAITNTSRIDITPFPGLRPFTMNESHLFFGREGQSDEMLYKLAKNRFVAVTGASGSGKSSLMYCGLIPMLQGGFIVDAGSKWKVIATHPGSRPISNLAESLVFSEENHGVQLPHDEKAIKISIMSSVLRSSSLGLVEAVDLLKRQPEENVLILIDQFEELFRFRKKGDTVSINEAMSFAKMMLAAVRQKRVPIYIVITMRSDFIGECGHYQELTELINESHYLVPQMTRENLRDAIIGPVAVAGGTISATLVHQLLNDVGDNPDQLPILQHALMRTWNYWKKYRIKDEPIDISHYDAIGRMEKAFSEHANEAYDELNTDRKIICQTIFKTLTEKTVDDKGIRQPTSVFDLASIAKCNTQEIIAVVDCFRAKERSFLTPSLLFQLDEFSIIDISHESLMRIWDKLIVWVEEEAASIKMYKRLSEAGARYQEGKAGLWRPPDLLLALSWRKEQQPTITWAQRFDNAFERTMVFLDTSEKEYYAEEQNKIRLQKKALRRSRIFALVLGIATVISLGFLLYSIVLRVEAKKQADKAETEKIRAEKSETEAKEKTTEALEQRKIADEQKTVAQRAAQIAEEQRILADEKSREALMQKTKADKNAQFANQQKLRAEQNFLLATKEKERADSNLNAAKKEKERAMQLRLLSIAQSMAVKSLQMNRDSNEKALIAYQAYLFNTKYKGEEFNHDIYNALYFGLHNFKRYAEPPMQAHNGAVRSVISLSSTSFISAGVDGKVFYSSLAKNNWKSAKIYNKSIITRCMAISSDRRIIACGTDNNNILVFTNFDTPEYSEAITSNAESIYQIVFGENAQTLYTTESDSCIRKWNLTTKTSEIIYRNKSRMKCLALSRNMRWLAAGTDNGALLLIDLQNNNKITEQKMTKGKIIKALTFSNDNSVLVLGDNKGNIQFWDMQTFSLNTQQLNMNAAINDIEFNATDNLMAVAGNDGYIQIWNTLDFNLSPIVLRDNNSWALNLDFSPDGSVLNVSYKDGQVKRWYTSSKNLANQICNYVTRNFTQEEWEKYVAKDIPLENTCK